MKIPEKITIGGITYDVIYKKKHDCAGEINYSKSKIILNKNNDKQYTEQTFIHECVHGILECLNFKDTAIMDEHFVNSFSNIMYQVIKQIE